MALLVAMFVLQTALVYSDRTGRELQPFSEEAMAGRDIWLSNNCQVCHQFYGYGGFLGPDLTNASARLDAARLRQILTEGAAQMPAFGMTPDQISAVSVFLREMDATGVGQARAPRPNPSLIATAVRQRLTLGGGANASAERGAEFFLGGTCSACHVALASNRIGAYLAPDLSLAVSTLSDDEIVETLVSGRPERGMPPAGMNPDQTRDMLGFLHWFAANRDELREAGLEGQPRGLPWWEFR